MEFALNVAISIGGLRSGRCFHGQGDISVKNVDGGASELEVMNGLGGDCGGNGEYVATGGLDTNGGLHTRFAQCDNGCCCHTGSAGEGFVLDAPFIGADEQGGIVENLDKVDVGALWGVLFVLAYCRTRSSNIDCSNIRACDDDVRYARIGIIDLQGFVVQHDRLIQDDGFGRWQMQGDRLMLDVGGNGARCRFKLHGCRGNFLIIGKPCNAACAIAAHIGFFAIGVEKLHAEMVCGIYGCAQEEEAICPDAGMVLTPSLDLAGCWRMWHGLCILQDDEVVAGSVHFPERHFHDGSGR